MTITNNKEIHHYQNDLYVRDYGHDVPKQSHLLKRVALAAVPFLSLHPALQLPVSLAMGSLRVVNSTGLDRGKAVASLAISVLNIPYGAVLTTLDDLIQDIQGLRRATQRQDALRQLVKIGGNLLFLGLRLRGGLELYLLSCAVQALISLLNAVDEFQNDRWIEASAQLLMSGVRLQQLHSQLKHFNQLWNIEKLMDKIFNGSTPDDLSLLAEILRKRHSGKEFDDRPLSGDQIRSLVEAARWSPSSYNDQPWNFIFCDRNTHPEAYAKAVESIYGQEWAEQAPLLVISVVRPEFVYNHKDNPWAFYDTGAAAMSMSLQAVQLGLMAHQIGGFDPESIQTDFHLPDGYKPITIIAIGYEKAPTAPTEQRERNPIEDNFFFGDWGQQ